MTRFEEIIGDSGIFKLILDNFFEGWPGTHDVMPAEDPEHRVFATHDKFEKFCEAVRSSREGYRLCMECDKEHASQASSRGEPISYICHAGLLDIAVPIIVADQAVATILCGQCRSSDQEQEKEGIQRTRLTEQALGLRKGVLLALRQKTARVSSNQIEGLKSKLSQVATYVSATGADKIEAQEARQELSRRLKESEAVHMATQALVGVVDDESEFWQKLDGVLSSICKVMGAECAAYLVHQVTPDGSRYTSEIKSVANMAISMVGEGYEGHSDLFAAAIREGRWAIWPRRTEWEQDELLGRMVNACGTGECVQTLAYIPRQLDGGSVGSTVLFLNVASDERNGLGIEEAIGLLEQVGVHVGLAYSNTQLYLRRKSVALLHSQWLENVSHQLVAPLTDVMGQAENLSLRLSRWQEDAPERIENALECLMESSRWAARLAANFAWLATDVGRSGGFRMKKEDSFVGRLIACVRDIQGMARLKGFSTAHVEAESLEPLNGRVRIDRRLFHQAVSNLLDNALKYGSKHTEILIRGSETDGRAHVQVINHGIRLRAEDVEAIFGREYRTTEAKEKRPIGSGIGLTISREMIRMHGGDLTAQPSKQTDAGWETTFTIDLPVIQERG